MHYFLPPPTGGIRQTLRRWGRWPLAPLGEEILLAAALALGLAVAWWLP